MNCNIEPTWEEMKLLFENGAKTFRDLEILGTSLLYYCCGKDPTPIAAFGSNIPLYVYCDTVGYGQGDFSEETSALYARLQKLGYSLSEKIYYSKMQTYLGNNLEITEWIDKNEKSFYLTYIQGDIFDVYPNLYNDCFYHPNSEIKPLCICNYRHEIFSNQSGGRKDLQHIEKRTDFVMGYCFDEKYRLIKKFKYYGDYEPNEEIVGLYKRKFWYLY